MLSVCCRADLAEIRCQRESLQKKKKTSPNSKRCVIIMFSTAAMQHCMHTYSSDNTYVHIVAVVQNHFRADTRLYVYIYIINYRSVGDGGGRGGGGDWWWRWSVFCGFAQIE